MVVARNILLIAMAAVAADGPDKPFMRTLSPPDMTTDEQSRSLSRDVTSALMACRDVLLKFRPGVYVGVNLRFDISNQPSSCAASFSLDRDGLGRVVFEGRQSPRFLTLLTDRPYYPGSVRNVEIRNYLNGIGVINDAKNGVGAEVVSGKKGLTIDNVVFDRIGAESSKKKGEPTGWGAITLSFTHNNVLTNNKFSGLGNATDSFLMHAVYLYRSSGNRIESNYFGAMDGAVLKFRDDASRNIVSYNKFRFEGSSLMQEWFCNADVRGAKNCPVPECPSKKIIFRNNQIIHSPIKDKTRRGGGSVSGTNSFVSYIRTGGLNIVEQYYVGRPEPKGCPVRGDADLPVDATVGNKIVRYQ